MLHRLLCAIGVHQWVPQELDLPYVWVERCRCCEKKRSGWTFYS